MRQRRNPSASEEDDGPRLISLQDKHEADRLLQKAFAAGEMDEVEFKRRRGRAYAAVTPRELWKATGHRAGSRERADKADIWRSVRLQLAIVVFAVIIMMFVLVRDHHLQPGRQRGHALLPLGLGQRLARP